MCNGAANPNLNRAQQAGEGEQLRHGHMGQQCLCLSAADDPSVSHSVFTITEKAPTRAFSWLKVPTSAFTFKTLLKHYATQALTPQ